MQYHDERQTFTIADPMISRSGRVYSLQGVRRLLAALAAAEEKNEKISSPRSRRVDNRCNAGKRPPHPEKRDHEQI